MSLGQCIPGLIEDGTITPERGRRMMAKYDELLKYYKGQMGEAAAAAQATEKTLEQLTAEAALRKRQELLQVAAQRDALKSMAVYAGGTKEGDPINPKAAVALFDRDGKAPYSNVEGRRKAIRGRAHAMIDELLQQHHTNVAGQVRQKAQLVDIVRELFGEDSGNVNAKELAEAWSGSAEMLRQRFNTAGGSIGKMARWGLPQSHDTRAVRKAGYDAWVAEIGPKLDRARMLDQETGLPFTDEAFGAALRNVFETLRTDGWNKRKPGGAMGAGKLANRHQDSRFLIFKDADGWMDYQAKFGTGTPFDSMMGHIDSMSREIALMEVLGPNPTASVRWLKDTITQSAETAIEPGTKAGDKAYAATKQIDRLYDEITGASGRAENRTLALGFSALRSFQTAAKLGSATLSAVTDTAFQTSTRHFNGLGASKMIGQYVNLFRPGSKADQKLAVRLGLIANEWSQRAAAQGRYLNEELSGDVSRRLAEGVLRLSGLSRWTEAGRWAFGMEFLGHITDNAGKTFDKLHPAFRGAMERYGIDAAGWEHIRATPLEEDRGVGWLKPANVADSKLGDKLLEMILTETDFAVPTADLRTKALINSVAPKGTWAGEIARSALLFKSFGISMVITQGRRIMEQSGPNAARYAAGLFIGTTLTGALALELKALASGKDPRPMDDAPFWGAAVLQGGGFGIFGDFLQSTENRFGGGFAGTLAGPLVGDLDTIRKAATGSHPGWELARVAKSEVPGQSLWYTKLAFDRLVTDQIQEAMDPNYRDSWRRMKKRADDQRTKFWWNPGQATPDRAPDMAAVAGQ
ncbi:MAG: hypothetical protein JWN66_4978 [Sphingomonas bacterium]|uniref:hypothetical protein n=1 Tax=Sphingomonas bacterium TaxID=1895847 RepID=UPI00261CDBE5|nr:hypothetical protein [Sphingomonas bacterium]MDB5707862.1 hypothetical protein [Sphingomonas bacterium]